MQRKLLGPERIIVPGEYRVASEGILKIYFRIFDNGHKKDLPPILVVSSYVDLDNLEVAIKYREQIEQLEDIRKTREFPDYVITEWERVGREIYESNMNNIYRPALEKIKKLRESGATHLLLDGNHRSIAAAITHNRVHALELQRDEDLMEARQMVERGELFCFPHEEKTLSEITSEFCYFIRNRDTFTVKERVEKLVIESRLPSYMIDRYLKGS